MKAALAVVVPASGIGARHIVRSRCCHSAGSAAAVLRSSHVVEMDARSEMESHMKICTSISNGSVRSVSGSSFSSLTSTAGSAFPAALVLIAGRLRALARLTPALPTTLC